VTIVRDRGFGVPHIYGATRDGAMFGLGYAGAEDRLFFMDALRHAGRAQLSSFAGGANRRWTPSSGRSRRIRRRTSSARRRRTHG
jgi:Penicillin amidase